MSGARCSEVERTSFLGLIWLEKLLQRLSELNANIYDGRFPSRGALGVHDDRQRQIFGTDQLAEFSTAYGERFGLGAMCPTQRGRQWVILFD